MLHGLLVPQSLAFQYLVGGDSLGQNLQLWTRLDSSRAGLGAEIPPEVSQLGDKLISGLSFGAKQGAKIYVTGSWSPGAVRVSAAVRLYVRLYIPVIPVLGKSISMAADRHNFDHTPFRRQNDQRYKL